MSAPQVVLFDGVCNLCHGSVQFIIARDPRQRFAFASLQSPAGQALLAAHGLPPDKLDSVLLLRDGRAYQKSTAALEITRQLRGGWPLLYVFRWVPRPVRDAVYEWVARHRYRWFGRQEACWVPTPALKARFLA